MLYFVESFLHYRITHIITLSNVVSSKALANKALPTGHSIAQGIGMGAMGAGISMATGSSPLVGLGIGAGYLAQKSKFSN